jgi:hypothetical protein
MKLARWAADSGLWRFFAHGIQHAESRVSRLTEPGDARDRELIAVLEGSMLARAARRVDAAMRAARSTSRLWPGLATARSEWRWGPPILIAVATHAMLILSQGTIGWLWMVIPAVAAAAGLLLVMSERS